MWQTKIIKIRCKAEFEKVYINKCCLLYNDIDEFSHNVVYTTINCI